VARVNAKTIYTVRHVYLTTMTIVVLLTLQTQCFILIQQTYSYFQTKTPCHVVTQSIKITSHYVHFQSEKQKIVCILPPEL